MVDRSLARPPYAGALIMLGVCLLALALVGRGSGPWLVLLTAAFLFLFLAYRGYKAKVAQADADQRRVQQTSRASSGDD